MIEICDWTNVLANVIGVAVAIWAFRRCRNKGYALIAVSYLMFLYVTLAAPHVNRWAVRRWSEGIHIHPTEQAQIKSEIDKEVDRIYKSHGIDNTVPRVHQQVLRIPIFNVLLVTGLWLVARNERITEQSGGE